MNEFDLNLMPEISKELRDKILEYLKAKNHKCIDKDQQINLILETLDRLLENIDKIITYLDDEEKSINCISQSRL